MSSVGATHTDIAMITFQELADIVGSDTGEYPTIISKNDVTEITNDAFAPKFAPKVGEVVVHENEGFKVYLEFERMNDYGWYKCGSTSVNTCRPLTDIERGIE